eukprot:jgi/Bigna1/73229/fgenesh1_pg.23_\
MKDSLLEKKKKKRKLQKGGVKKKKKKKRDGENKGRKAAKQEEPGSSRAHGKEGQKELSTKKKQKALIDSDDEGQSDDDTLKINEGYAKHYINTQKSIAKQKAENKMARLLANLSDDDMSDSEEEDEDGSLLTATLDEEIHETILKIRKKDPSIYSKEAKFYAQKSREGDDEGDDDDDEEEEEAVKKRKNKKKGISVKQYLVARAKDDLDNEGRDEAERRPMTKAEESAMIKKNFITLANEGDDDEDDGADDFFSKKEKSKDEIEKEEREFGAFLKEEEQRNHKKKLERLVAGSAAGETENLSKDDRFLRDFIANEWWRAKDTSNMPSYEEIMGEEEPDQPEVDDDEKELEKAEAFEHAYNFRFEEKGSNEIITYPREIEESVRLKKSKRKRQRDAKKARREEEMEKKAQEIRKLKKQKRAEITEKLRELRDIAGDIPMDINLDGDFDPDAHDAMMHQAFDDEYYGDVENPDALIHPEQNLLEQETSEFEKRLFLQPGMPCRAYYRPDNKFYDAVIVRKLPRNRFRVKFSGYEESADLETSEVRVAKLKEGDEDGKSLAEDGDKEAKPFNVGDICEARYEADGKFYKAKVLAIMEAENSLRVQYQGYDEEAVVPFDDVRVPGTKKTVGNANAKLRQMTAERKEIEALLDEVDKLDYEDLIGGDIPTRFRYKKVEPLDFGMTVKEILETPDKVLRQRVSMKHLAPYKNVRNMHWRKFKNSRPQRKNGKSIDNKREGGGKKKKKIKKKSAKA